MQQVFSAYGIDFKPETHALINCLMSSAIDRLEQQLSSNSAASQPSQLTLPWTNTSTPYSSPELHGSCQWGQLDHMSTAPGLWSQPGDLGYTEFGTEIPEPAPLDWGLASTPDNLLFSNLGGWASASPDLITNSTMILGSYDPYLIPWSQSELPGPTFPHHTEDMKVDDSKDLDCMEDVLV